MSQLKKILVIDDNPDSLDIICSFLANENYELTVSGSGKNAVDILADVMPDLILLDIIMPGWDGYKTCRIIKSINAFSDVPIIFVTAKLDEIAQGFAAGGSDYINKPINKNELVARVGAHIRANTLFSELQQSQKNLEEKIQERTKELTEANLSLKAEVKERRMMQERLSFLSQHDFLTQLYNRSSFESHLSTLLARTQRNKSKSVFLLVDLDNFKRINDICGHLAGDVLLRQVSEVIKEKLRYSDILARIGSDEFGVLLEDCCVENGQRIAIDIRDSINTFEFTWEEQSFLIEACIGLVNIDKSKVSAEQVITTANNVCRMAKEKGSNQIEIDGEHTDEFDKQREEINWTVKLERALNDDLFVLYFQRITPLLSTLKKGEVFEILLRLKDPYSDKIISPGEFLPSAERYKITPKIDRWVVNSMFSYLNDNPEFQSKIKHCAINLSGLTLQDEKFFKELERHLLESQIPPEILCFEVTETVAITNITSTVNFIKRFRELGCKFSLDDFGSGFSSYGYLKSLPVDFLKIDGMFIRDLEQDAISEVIVRSINDVGHVMGKQVIAEFVENKEIAEKLKAMGVEYAQGFGLHRPEPIAGLFRNAKKTK